MPFLGSKLKMCCQSNEMRVYYWAVTDRAFLDSMLTGEKHFKYFAKNGKFEGSWMLLGCSGTKSYDILIKLGRQAISSDMEKHSDEYHVRHGILDPKGNRRDFAYLIDEVIRLPLNTTFKKLQNNIGPQLLQPHKNQKYPEHASILLQVKKLVETLPAQYLSRVFSFFCFFVFHVCCCLGWRSARTVAYDLRCAVFS